MIKRKAEKELIYAGNLDQKKSDAINVIGWKHLENPDTFFNEK